MEGLKKGDFVVPLFEEKKRVLRVSNVGNSVECEIEHGWEISAKPNYRMASDKEVKELYEEFR